MANAIVATFYRFVTLRDITDLKSQLQSFCDSHKIKGTILLAREGINATVAGSRNSLDKLKELLDQIPEFKGLAFKESINDTEPFYRMKVRLKNEIVTMGVSGVDPNQKVGHYVDAKEWDELISQQDVLVVDTRNTYEVDIGTFHGAVNPNIQTFRQFPDFVDANLDPKKHKKVAMFCTGGIRCEKATSYLLEKGFEQVFHLQGGILKYFEVNSSDSNTWNGECFVFDNRVAVNQNLEKGSYDQCHGCRHPITEKDKHSSDYVPGVSCPYCHDSLTDRQKQSAQERQRQMKLAETRNYTHLGSAQKI